MGQRAELAADELAIGERLMEQLHRPSWMAPGDAEMRAVVQTWSDHTITSQLECYRENLRDTLAHYLRLLSEARSRGLDAGTGSGTPDQIDHTKP